MGLRYYNCAWCDAPFSTASLNEDDQMYCDECLREAASVGDEEGDE